MMNQMGPKGPAGQAAPENPITKIDADLSQMIPQLASLPNGNKLAERMAKVQAEYRAIMEEAIRGGGDQGVPTVESMRSRPMPERSMGIPASPAGPY